MALIDDKRDKGMSFTQMVIEENSTRNGRGLSDQWADSMVVRPRTTERHITVHKRLVLGFAISILGLIIVTIIAVLLSVKFEKCGVESINRIVNTTMYSGGKLNHSREGRGKATDLPWAQVRLPSSLRPSHYDLNLTVSMDNLTFSGAVLIHIDCVNSTKHIVLHADKLSVKGAEVTLANSSVPLGIRKYFMYPKTQVLVISLTQPLKAREHYTVKINYDDNIGELIGFFRSPFVTSGEMRYLVVTQFSPIYARKVFPCFDEPAYKATFRITIKHQDAYLALSNMPVDAIIPEGDGWVTEQFAETPRMSTYYLGWAICNCTFKETVTDHGIPVRLYARPDAIEQGSGDYALNITKKMLKFYEQYFNINYSLPKLDLLAVPKFPYSAMENWGLNIFVEEMILLDPEVSSISALWDITMVVVHEICHQWFGNLVTPIWWEDVWLKEGFARYFEHVGTDYLNPEFNMGAALIRMLVNFMGENAFQKGLQEFLKAHLYGNAGRDDLWNTLKETMQNMGENINIKEIMDSWTIQMGYPVVTIIRDEKSVDLLTVKQELFIYNIKRKSMHLNSKNSSYIWKIPLTVGVGNLTHISTEAMIWIHNETEQHRISMLGESSWLLGNLNQTGYFRVNYDLRNWRLLIEQLMTKPEVISVGNRAGLINDAFNLARAGYLPQSIPLEIMKYLSNEKEFLPWEAASDALIYLDRLVDLNKDYNIFRQYIAQQVAPMYNLLGWPEDAANSSDFDTSYQTEALRQKVLVLACTFGIDHCHKKAILLLSEWMETDENRIPQSVREIVYCTGISLMDDNMWEFIWSKYESSNAILEQKFLLKSLACSKNSELLSRLLNLTLSSQLTSHKSVSEVIIQVSTYPAGRDLAWKYFQENWSNLYSRFGEALFISNLIIRSVTKFWKTEIKLNELYAFVKNLRKEEYVSFTESIAIVEANVWWHEQLEDELFQWLRKSLKS
ncbi:thyrotropin-releasing hormone-degrading ectoenzyme-like isoform X2 [Hemitrygon akajei]|uniref:thyrotropin-releasing hormone-degrading ectoenzyme-like isoform X2 n=1 Tax=Hemitrygon akajei TaxID=2704970 RepID=UPI003BF9E065